LNYDANVFLIF